MQPFQQARAGLTPQTNVIHIGTNTYRADPEAGVVVERSGDQERRYPIQEALGGKNVSYFLTPLERGRLQVLPVAYDVRRKEWFDTAASAVRHFPGQPDQAFHWTERPFTFNTSCYNCHVSQLDNHYDTNSDTYHTTWREPGINCETCHGPAGDHVRNARQLPPGGKLDKAALVRFQDLDNDQINSLCGSCHARINPVRETFAPGDRFFDSFGLLTLEHPDFYPDGRDLGENFTMTSWRLSRCAASGQLSCIHCHTSSGRNRFQGSDANNACLPCHESTVKSVSAHTHHAADSAGSQCVSCHMPATEFARMRRSDHSMRPPAPAATLAFGSPNACNVCHTNQNAAWSDKWVRQWSAVDYQKPLLQRGKWIADARKGDWSSLPEMARYLSSSEREEVWTASLIRLLRECDQEAKWPGIRACLKDKSPLVRAAAVDAFAGQVSAEMLAPLLMAARDSSLWVRTRAAAVLAGAPEEYIPAEDRSALESATRELLRSYTARPDDPGAFLSLGNYYMDSQQPFKAIAAFKTATQRDPGDLSPWVNLSMAFNLAGSNDLAESSLREALRLSPTNAAANLNLGLLCSELGRLDEAEKAFRIALKSDPKSAVAAYNLGVLLAKSSPEESLRWCRAARDLRPAEPKYAYTLAYFQNTAGQPLEAIGTLEKLLEISPPHADAYALLASLYSIQNRPDDALKTLQRAQGNPRLSTQERARFAAQIQRLASPAATP